jgi:hypothetical protein
MEKDSLANVVSYAGLASVFMNWESVLTIALLISGIILNALRIRDNLKNKKGESDL